MAQQTEKISQEQIDQIIKAAVGGGGPQAPADISEWIVIRHPSTGEPLYYQDPKNSTNRIPIPAAPEQGPKEVATPVSQLVYLDANFKEVAPGADAVWVRDPKTGTALKILDDARTGDPSKWQVIPVDPAQPDGPRIVYDPTASKVVASVPVSGASKPSDPSQWKPIYRVPGDPTSGVVGQWDPVNNAPHPVSQEPSGNKPSDPSKWTPQYRVPGDPSSGLVGQWDPVNGLLHPVSKDPTTQKQFVNTGTSVLVFDDDGKLISTTPYEKDQPYTVVMVGDTAYRFDPNEKDPNKAFVKGPTGEAPTHVGVSTDNKTFVFFKDGKQVGEPVDNPNYEKQQTAAPPTSLSSPTIPRWNPKTGQWEEVPNTGRLTISDATQALVKELTGLTVDPNNPLTLDEATTLLQTAINKMNADANKAQVDVSKAQIEATREGTARAAAGDILTNISQGATTGAGVLQNRAATAQNLLQQGLGVATSTGGRYGNYSGGMLNPVPGLAQGLVQGSQGLATEMHGGQATLDTALRMVQAADPNNQNPDRAAAVGLIRQIMDGYQTATGQKHPAVVATEAAQQSQAAGGFVPPAPPLQNYVPTTFPGGGTGLMQPRQWNTPPESAEQAIARAQAFTAPPLAAPVPVLAV